MRPDFDQIVKRLQGEIGDEIKRKEEPVVVVYSVEPDAVYQDRIGKDDEIEDSDEEEEGTKRATVRDHEAKLKSALEEMKEKMEREKEKDLEEERGIHAKRMEEVMEEMAGLKKKLEEKEGADVDAEIYKALMEAGAGGGVAEEEGEGEEDVDDEIRKLLGLS
jgi:hypothetical protein